MPYRDYVDLHTKRYDARSIVEKTECRILFHPSIRYIHLKLQRILLRQVFVANLRLRSRVQTHVRSFPISLVAPFIPLPLLHLSDLFPRDVEKSRSLPRRIGNESIPAPIFCALAWPLNPFFHEESTCSRASELKSCCIRGNTK